MTVHEIRHPNWGSNLANQLSAKVWKNYGTDGYQYTEVVYTTIFGNRKTKTKTAYIGHNLYEADDADEEAKREFKHRCGLLKIVMMPGRNGPVFAVFLDGHVVSNFDSGEMEYRFAPEELGENGGKPIAELMFSGKGKRFGPLRQYGTSHIICTFADQKQMNEYLDVTNRRMPKAIVYQGETYSSTSTGQYQSDSGSMLPLLMVMYFLLPNNEREAFAAQNPEIQGMLGSDASGREQTDGAVYTETAGSDSTPDFNGATQDQQFSSDFGLSDIGGSVLTGSDPM